MPRQVRLQFEGAVYHVMARGDRREPIVVDEQDCRSFEKLWEEAVGKTGWRVFAWVLMKNHYHAVIRTPEANLVEGMKWVQNTWTRRFNVRHHQWGHLFGGRYKSMHCEEGEYLSRLIDYVHLNPVRAGILRADRELESYLWSSLSDYVKPARLRRKWVDAASGLCQLRYEDTAAGRKTYLKALNESIDWSDPKRAGLAQMEGQGLQATLRRGWYFGAESFREKLLERVEGLVPAARAKAARGYSGEEMRDHGTKIAERIVRCGLEHFGILEWQLGELRKGDGRKILLSAIVREKTTVPLEWIAGRLHMGVKTRVSRATREATDLLKRSGKARKDRLAILGKARIID